MIESNPGSINIFRVVTLGTRRWQSQPIAEASYNNSEQDLQTLAISDYQYYRSQIIFAPVIHFELSILNQFYLCQIKS